MASITFSGQLDQAMNEAAAEGNKVLFIPQQTVGEVLPGAASELVVESDGSYSITLAYNTYSIYHYSDVTKRKTLIATDIVVSADTAVSTIPDLIGSTVPVTEDSVLTIQGYLTDAQESATAAATSESNAAASEAAVTNRVAAYEVDSTEYLISTFDGSTLDTGDVVRTLGYYTAGDGGGYDWVKTGVTGTASQDASTTGSSSVYDSSGNEFSPVGSESITLNIPTDFSTLQLAIDSYSVNSYFGSNVIINLNIESGHSPSSGISVQCGDFSKFRIISEDDTVTLDSTFSIDEDFVEAINARAPVLACLIDANSRARHGYHVSNSSTGYVEEECGVINTTGTDDTAGLHVVYASTCYARNSVFTGSYRNLWVAHESQCYADFSTLSGGTGDTNVYAARSSIVGVSYSDMTNSAGSGMRARRSILTALAADVSNAAYDGILSQEGSIIIANDQSADPFLAENCGQHGVSCDAAYVDFSGGSAIGATASAIRATSGAKVIASSSTLSTQASPSAFGINAEASEVIADSAIINYTTSNSVSAYSGCRINISDATITASSGRAIDIAEVSDVEMSGATVTDSASDGLRVSSMSRANAISSTITGSGSGYDIVTRYGGQVSANSATTTNGSPSLSDTNASAFNSLSSTGVIFS